MIRGKQSQPAASEGRDIACLWLHRLSVSYLLPSKYWPTFWWGTIYLKGWSSGLREMTHVWEVRILAHYGHIFLHLIFVKIVFFVWKEQIKWKRGRGWPIFKNILSKWDTRVYIKSAQSLVVVGATKYVRNGIVCLPVSCHHFINQNQFAYLKLVTIYQVS